MADNNRFEELDDLEFERLFASLDDVKASDELKASTLHAIFAQADEPSATGAEKAKGRGFVLIEGTARTEGARPEATQEDVSATAQAHAPIAADATDGTAGAAPTKRARAAWKKGAFMLRVAAALLVFALVAGGTVACAVPATHVYATAGETTFDLGVNLFGFTVSAEADSDAGKEILEDVDVRFERFGEAFDRILEAYEQRGGEDEPTVRVESSAPFDGGERLGEEAQNVMDTHEWIRDEQQTRNEEEARSEQKTNFEEATPSMDDKSTSGLGGTEGYQNGGEAPNGNTPKDEPVKTEAPQRITEQRTPEATPGPTEQIQPTDGRTGEAEAGQPGQDMPNQDAGQPSGGAAEMDGGGTPPR